MSLDVNNIISECVTELINMPEEELEKLCAEVVNEGLKKEEFFVPDTCVYIVDGAMSVLGFDNAICV